MFKIIAPKLFLALVLSLTFVNIELIPSHTAQKSIINIGSEVVAQRSGGRSGGGSFNRGSSGSSSRSRSNNNRSSGSSRQRSSGNTTIIYNTGSGSRSYQGGSRGNPILNFLGFIFMMAIFGVVIFAKSNNSSQTAKAKGDRIRDNDIVTISKLQVALLSQATGVQRELSELILNVDTNTDQGLLELLQESVLILLRHSEYWSHVLASSESININQAEEKFNQISIAERSKMSAETLTNVQGKYREKEILASEDTSSDYIVVTLILGTADDEPLFKDIYTTEQLKAALEKLASLRPDYLMKIELLWSPQQEEHSLSYDEFITEYTEMRQI